MHIGALEFGYACGVFFVAKIGYACRKGGIIFQIL